MAFFANGQSKSSHSHDSNGSDFDSQEQRFYAKVNRVGRQRSSSPSASPSDSEQEEVSTRPAPEKTAAPPSLKKNPNSSDRYAVRNWSIPSEPNPNIASASKAKKGVAAKRAKDDYFAEEQLESKKKLVSKVKKHAEDDEGQPEQKKKSVSKRTKAVDGEQPEPKKNVDEAAEGQTEPRKKVDDATEGQTEPRKKPASKGKKPGEKEVPASKQITAGEDQISAGKDSQDQITAGKDNQDQIAAGEDHTSAGALGARAQMLEEKWRELEILETQATMMRYALLHEKCALHLELLKSP